jgi:hypothetical protein
MKLCVRVLAFTFAGMMASPPLFAQVASQEEARSRAAVEVTPFVALGSHASSRIGAAIAFAWTSRLSMEAEVGYRRGEIDALSSSVSLLYDLPRIGRIAPYVAGGAGLQQYGSAIELPSVGVITQSATAFTVNAGGGVKVPASENWGIRSDARWFNSVGKGGPEHWRLYNGVTFRTGKR